MGKRQQEALHRLEEALLDSEPQDALPHFGEAPSRNNARAVYNTDETDVDLDAYSEDVQDGSKGGTASAVITMLIMVLLAAGILFLLKVLGVL